MRGPRATAAVAWMMEVTEVEALVAAPSVSAPGAATSPTARSARRICTTNASMAATRAATITPAPHFVSSVRPSTMGATRLTLVTVMGGVSFCASVLVLRSADEGAC